MSLALQSSQPTSGPWERQSPRATRLVTDSYRYAFALAHDASRADELVQTACRRVHQRGEDFTKRGLFSTVREAYFESEAEAGDLSSGQSNGGNLAALSATERELAFLLSAEGWSMDDFAAHTGRFGRSADGFLIRVREKLGIPTSQEATQVAVLHQEPFPEAVRLHLHQMFSSIQAPATTFQKLHGLMPAIEKAPEPPPIERPLPSWMDTALVHAKRHGLKILAVLTLAAFARTCIAGSTPVRDWVQSAAQDVANSHEPGTAVEFPASDAGTLASAMQRLDFQLVLTDDVLDDDEELLGASYATVLGRPAALVQVQRKGGETGCFYVCRAGEALAGMSSSSYTFDPYEVDVWEEDGLLYFEVELD